MTLTDIALRKAKAMDKLYKATDNKGLYLLVTSSGGDCTSWRGHTQCLQGRSDPPTNSGGESIIDFDVGYACERIHIGLHDIRPKIFQ